MIDDPGEPTDSAHHAWEASWSTEEGRARWLEPEPEVVSLAAELFASGGRRALDLGCGVGRHILPLARAGFSTHGLDASRAGLVYARGEAEREGLETHLVVGKMTRLPHPDDCFDYLLAWNVIYHGDGDVVRRSLEEIVRVLRPGGWFQGTMISKQNTRFGRGREIAPHTFVLENVEDKGHPHFYSDEPLLAELFSGWEVRSLTDVDQGQGAFHWHLVARPPA